MKLQKGDFSKEASWWHGEQRASFGMCKQSVEAHGQDAWKVHSESTTHALGPKEETCVWMVIKWAE